MHIKNLRKPAAAALAALLATSLLACGATDKYTSAQPAEATDWYDDGIAYDVEMAPAYDMEFYADVEEYGEVPASRSATSYSLAGSGSGGNIDTDSLPSEQRKIIMRASVRLESLEYDATVAALLDAVKAHGGYVSDSNLYNNTVGYRNASYTVRIPAENYNTFLHDAEDAGNLVSRSESSEDITAQYTDVEARLKSLKVQEERLLEMLGESADIETLLAIQTQLSDVQYQIEYYESTKRGYDSQVSYSTISIDVSEVTVYTEPEPEGYLSRLSRALQSGWQDALEGLKNLGLGLVYASPVLLVLAAGLVVLLVLLRRRKKKRAKKAAEKMQQQAETKKEPKTKD